MRFDWDRRKASSNHGKHGVTFEEAITAFDDPFALVAPDHTHSRPDEKRGWWIGEADVGLLVVVFTIREQQTVYRIISARRASRKERRRYEKAKRVSF